MSGPFQIQVAYSFDRLLEPKLAQAYDILVPCRERPMGVRVKELDHENGSHLRKSFVRAAARREDDCEPGPLVRCRFSWEKGRKFGDNIPLARDVPIRRRSGLVNNQDLFNGKTAIELAREPGGFGTMHPRLEKA